MRSCLIAALAVAAAATDADGVVLATAVLVPSPIISPSAGRATASGLRTNLRRRFAMRRPFIRVVANTTTGVLMLAFNGFANQCPYFVIHDVISNQIGSRCAAGEALFCEATKRWAVI